MGPLRRLRLLRGSGGADEDDDDAAAAPFWEPLDPFDIGSPVPPFADPPPPPERLNMVRQLMSERVVWSVRPVRPLVRAAGCAASGWSCFRYVRRNTTEREQADTRQRDTTMSIAGIRGGSVCCWGTKLAT